MEDTNTRMPVAKVWERPGALPAPRPVRQDTPRSFFSSRVERSTFLVFRSGPAAGIRVEVGSSRQPSRKQ